MSIAYRVTCKDDFEAEYLAHYLQQEGEVARSYGQGPAYVFFSSQPTVPEGFTVEEVQLGISVVPVTAEGETGRASSDVVAGESGLDRDGPEPGPDSTAA